MVGSFLRVISAAKVGKKLKLATVCDQKVLFACEKKAMIRVEIYKKIVRHNNL